MADYTIKALADVTDFLGDYPGEMRLATYEIGAEQAALTWRRMPAQTGGKGSYGHRHKTQEEIYLVVSGTLQFKLDDDVVDVPAGTVVRVAPEVVRSVWNEGPDDVELVIAARKIDDPERRRRARARLLARLAGGLASPGSGHLAELGSAPARSDGRSASSRDVDAVELVHDAADLEHAPHDRRRPDLQPQHLRLLAGETVCLEDVVDERRVDEPRLTDVDHDELVLGDEQPEQAIDLLARRHVVLAAALDDCHSRRRVEHLDIGSGVHPSLRGVVIACV